MENLTCVLDTSVFIDYFRRPDKGTSSLFLRFADPGPAISAITLMELECGTSSRGHQEFLVGVLQRYPVLPFDGAAGRMAGEIYRQLR